MSHRPAWQVRLASILMYAATGTTALFFAILGAHDALLATQREERLVGILLLAAGIFAVLGIVWWRSGRFLRSALAFSVATLGGLQLSAIQISFRHDGRTFLWVLSAAIPATVAVLAYRRRPPGGPGWTETRTGIAVAAVTALAVPLISLVGGAFRPQFEPETLVVETAMKVAGERKDASGRPYKLVRTDIKLKNTSKRRLIVFGSSYGISAGKAEPRTRKPPVPWTMGEELKTNSWSSRHETPWREDLIEIGYDFFPPGNYLDPGQEDVTSIITVVSPADTDTVVAHAAVATIFADRAILGVQREFLENQKLSADGGVSASWRLWPTGWLAELIRGNPALRVTYWVETSENPRWKHQKTASARVLSSPRMGIEVGPDQQAPSDRTVFTQRISSYYGAGTSGSEATVALEEETSEN